MDTTSVIEKIIDFTKKDDLAWYYLSELPVLAKKSSIQIGSSYFKDSSSFYTKSDLGFFVLIEHPEEPELYLIVFPTLDSKDIQRLNTYSTYQKELLRLQNLIKRKFPNVEDFLESFLAK